MGERITTIGRQYEVDDADLQFQYAKSRDSGVNFGLRIVSFLTAFNPRYIEIEFARHQPRIIDVTNLDEEPKDIEYSVAYGGGSSHGATWENLVWTVRDILSGYRQLGRYDVEHSLNALVGLTYEGAQNGNSGMEVIFEGLVEARADLPDHWYNREPMLLGLGYIASNFAERDAHQMAQLAAPLHAEV